MAKHSKVYVLIMMSLMFCLIAPKMTLAELPFGAPKANKNVSNLVSFEFAEKIALKKAIEKWGDGTIGPALTACDDDGYIVAYMFPFAIGGKTFPAYSEILSSVKYGREIAANQMYLEQESQIELGNDMMIGAGRYGTIVVSARYDRFPVPLYMHFLPPYFYEGDMAIKKAKEAFSTESVNLERIYFLERFRSQYFEFSSNGRSILVNASDLEVLPGEKVLTHKGKKGFPDPDVMSLITEEWTKIEREVQ